MSMSHYREIKSFMDFYNIEEDNKDSIINTIIENDYEDSFDDHYDVFEKIYEGDEFDNKEYPYERIAIYDDEDGIDNTVEE